MPIISWVADPLPVAATLARMATAVAIGAVPVAGLLPWRMRFVVACAVTVAATPLAVATQPVGPARPPVAVLLGGEMLVGLALGTAVAAVMAAAGQAGRLLGSVSGLSWADDFSPEAAGEEAGIARLAWWLGMGGFFAAGGHLAVIGGLIDSVRVLPAGTVFRLDAGPESSPLVTLVTTLPSLVLELALAVGCAALAAVVAFHVAAAVCLRTVRYAAGPGFLQGLAAVALLAVLFIGAEAWCGGFGILAHDHVARVLVLEPRDHP
jgi:flagellar biosynthetic protein FliR